MDRDDHNDHDRDHNRDFILDSDGHDHVVDDPEQESATDRRDRINDLRKAVIDHRNRIFSAIFEGHLTDHQGHRLYRSAVESYLMATESLFYQFGRLDLWQNQELGPILIPPPDDGPDDLNPRRASVPGLQGIVELPNPVTASWTYEEGYWYNQETTATSEATLPPELLDTAVRQTGNFLDDIGFGLDRDENDDEWEL